MTQLIERSSQSLQLVGQSAGSFGSGNVLHQFGGGEADPVATVRGLETMRQQR